MKIFQKKFEKKIKKELKSKLAHSDMNLEESYSNNKSVGQSDSISITDTRMSNSIHTSKKPKIKGQQTEDSHEKNTKKFDQSSPNNSSTLKNKDVTSSEHDHSINKQIYNTKIKKALDDTIPSSLNNPLKYVERLLAQNQFHFKNCRMW